MKVTKEELLDALKKLVGISYRIEGCSVPECRVCLENKKVIDKANEVITKTITIP